MVPKLNVVKPMIRANKTVIRKQKKIYGSAKSNQKNPTILVLKNTNNVDNNSRVDSSEEKKIINFLLSHKNGR